MYLTYAQYTAMGGTKVNETAFPLFEFKARQRVNLQTQNKLVDLTERPEALNYLMFDLINKLFDVSAGDRVASFSNDGVSTSFVIEKSTDAEIIDLIDSYLPEYTYRGVETCW